MRFALFLVTGLLVCAPFAHATETLSMPPQPESVQVPLSSDMVPPIIAGENPVALEGQLPAAAFPLLRLTPDKIDVVRLESDAVNVLVGNSAHLLAVIETPRQILLVPRAPGATHFQVLDAQGKTIMERSVIVASPKQDYIRVRRACATKDSGSCTEYSVFYCPDMCHAINVPQASSSSSTGANVPSETASSGAAANGANTGASDAEGLNDEQPVPASAPANAGAAARNMLMVP